MSAPEGPVPAGTPADGPPPRPGHEAGDANAITKLFWFLLMFLAGAAVVYGIASKEWAGTVMLLGAGLLAGLVGFFLTVERWPEPTADGPGVKVRPVRATDTIWPLELGAGLAGVLAGFPLGLWIALPGAALIAHGALRMATDSASKPIAPMDPVAPVEDGPPAYDPGPPPPT